MARIEYQYNSWSVRSFCHFSLSKKKTYTKSEIISIVGSMSRETTVKCVRDLASQGTLSSSSLGGSCDVGASPYMCQMRVDCLRVHGVRMGGYLLAIST